MTGIDCTADEPVPMMPTRIPVKSTPSCGQWWVKYDGPRNFSVPGMSGAFAADRQPVAMTTYLAVTTSPRSVSTRQVRDGSSHWAAVTRVLNLMSRRRSKRSATWRAYLRISGWGA